MSKIIKLVLSILFCLLAGVVGSFFTIPAIPDWYAGLIKPFFSPPNWVFGPVWTVLYIFMGLSLYLVWEKGTKKKKVKEALKLFAIQLLLNWIWSPVFFGTKNLFLAFVVIVLMWFFILKTVLAFSKINKTASYLLYPYFAWVSFASILNFSVWFLNR